MDMRISFNLGRGPWWGNDNELTRVRLRTGVTDSRADRGCRVEELAKCQVRRLGRRLKLDRGQGSTRMIRTRFADKDKVQGI